MTKTPNISSYSNEQLFEALEWINEKLHPQRAKAIYLLLAERVGEERINEYYQPKEGLAKVLQILGWLLFYPFMQENQQPREILEKIDRIKAYSA